MRTKNFSDILTLHEASTLLRVHPNTLRNWDEKNILNSVRFGNRRDRHYRRQDIESFMHRQEIQHTVPEQNTVQSQNAAFEKLFYASLDLIKMPHDQLYKEIIQIAQKLSDSDFGSIFITEHGALHRIYASENTLYDSNMPRRFGRTNTAFFTQKAYSYVIKNAKDTNPTMEHLGVKSITYIPLSYEGKSIGVINMLSKNSSPLAEKTYHLLELYGSLVNVIMTKAA